MPQYSFSLWPKPPFRLDFTVWALRRLPINKIDHWDGKTYTRIVIFNDEPARMDIEQPGPPEIRVSVRSKENPVTNRTVAGLVERLLGIRKYLNDFYSLASQDEHIAPLAADFQGLKPPRFPSVFEALINAIACQQLSLNVGITILNRLTTAFGRSWEGDGQILHAFPLPDDLVSVLPQDLRLLGFSVNKAQAIITLAKDVVAGKTDLEQIASMEDQAALTYLRKLGGIGRWSAEYALLRGLGRIHILPGDDVGAQKNLQVLLHLKQKPDYDRIKKITAKWYPYAGFLYFHFLLNRLKMKFYL